MNHAVLGASASPRWKACPGSVREIEKIPPYLRDRKNNAAAEGNAAHSLAEACLRGSIDAAQYLGYWIHPEGTISNKKAHPEYFEITDEMVDAVQIYLNVVRGHLERLPGSELLIEQSVKPLAERDDMFGTADAIVIEPYGEIVVIDFKYGVRHVVEPEQNDQALFYALGALERIGDDAAVSAVTIVIVQPRAFHEKGVVRGWRTTVETVRAEADQLRSAARATEDPAAPLIPGDVQCHWCPAAGRCPALSQLAITTAVDDYPDLEGDLTLRLPDLSDPEQMARALKLADIVDLWSPAVRSMAFHAANAGAEIPGHKLVRGTKHRQWIDEETARIALRDDKKIGPELFMTAPKLKTPSQIEKVVGTEWVAQYATKPLGELTLVPIDDKRPAQLPALLAAYPEDL